MINPNNQEAMQALAVGLAVHRPRVGDAVEQWLKSQRDAYHQHCPQWQALDETLDTYRLHAYTGTPLHEHVCEGGNEHCDCMEAGR